MACSNTEITIVRNNLNNTGTCRVCMRKNLTMKTLFSSDCKIVQRIQFCTGILLTENPISPSFICTECMSQLNIAHNFKNMCIESENSFRQLNFKVEIKTEKLDKSAVKEEIEYLYENEVEIENLREVGLIKKESLNPTNDIAKRDQAVPKSTKNTIKRKEITEPTTNIIKKKGIPMATTKTIKLKVVKCSAKSFNRICKENEKKIPKKYRRIKFRKLCCRKCNMRFETKEESIRHHEDIHKLSKYVCEICGKQFVYRASHTTHMRIHVGTSFACAHCSYTTVNKTDLKKHLTIHTGEKNYHCHACTDKFRTSSNLHIHIRQKHGPGRVFPCDRCDKTFVTGNGLKRHSDVHNKIKRYVCPICPSRFTARNHWKRHLLSQHAVSVPRAKPGRRKTSLDIESTPSIFDNKNEITHNLNTVKQDKMLTE